jgi:molybdenum cofactor cytidylyltransferase
MNRSGAVGAVILAAGSSRRFGSAKQLAVLDGRTLLEHAISAAVEAGLDPVVAVVPIWLTRPASLGDERLRWVRNPHPERGISVSLRLGLRAVGEAAAAAVILLGDQPRLGPSVIPALVSARGDRPVVATEAGGLMAPPILLEREVFTLAEAAVGDIGLRQILREHPDLVRGVPIARHPPDVDTPDDLAALDRP